MASQRVEWFLAAKKALRAHPDFTNEQVADHCGIPRGAVDQVVPQARREIEQDGLDIASQHAKRMTRGD